MAPGSQGWQSASAVPPVSGLYVLSWHARQNSGPLRFLNVPAGHGPVSKWAILQHVNSIFYCPLCTVGAEGRHNAIRTNQPGRTRLALVRVGVDDVLARQTWQTLLRIVRLVSRRAAGQGPRYVALTNPRPNRCGGSLALRHLRTQSPVSVVVAHTQLASGVSVRQRGRKLRAGKAVRQRRGPRLRSVSIQGAFSTSMWADGVLVHSSWTRQALEADVSSAVLSKPTRLTLLLVICQIVQAISCGAGFQLVDTRHWFPCRCCNHWLHAGRAIADETRRTLLTAVCVGSDDVLSGRMTRSTLLSFLAELSAGGPVRGIHETVTLRTVDQQIHAPPKPFPVPDETLILLACGRARKASAVRTEGPCRTLVTDNVDVLSSEVVPARADTRFGPGLSRPRRERDSVRARRALPHTDSATGIAERVPWAL
eukprot:1672583-Rhodomonas_salina.1